MANKSSRSAGDYRGALIAPVSEFTVVANAPAARLNKNRIIKLTLGGTGSVPCLAVSDGTNWKQIAIGSNAI